MRPEGGHDDHSTLRGYLSVLRRRKWIILQALVVVPIVAVWLSLRQVPLYQSAADVLVGRTSITASLTGIQDPITYYRPERLAQTQAELARVPQLASRVLKRAGITDRSAQAFLGQSTAEAADDADLFSFNVIDTNPAVATQLATAYAEEFTKFKREIDTGSLVRARKGVETRLAQLKRDGESDSPLYASLIEKEQQLRTIEALQDSSTYVVRRAEGAFQIQPSPVRDGVLGLLLGLALGIGLAFLREALDTRIRSTAELDRLGLPLLARIPEPPRRLRSKNRLVMLAEPNGAQAEAFRILKTNFEFANLDRGARTVMVTSTIEGEGKSTTVANLAVAFARAGTRVILVDLDLRRPALHRFFPLDGRPGLTQVALGHAGLDEALTQVTGVNGRIGAHPDDKRRNGGAEGSLEVLRAGPIPPDVGEFVGKEALGKILAELRERAELVLIDSPPLLHVGDTRALSSRVDGVIVVARLKVLRRPMLRELERVLDSTPAEKLGIVLTGAESEDGYGYGYGYGSYARPYGRRGQKKEEEEIVA
jgi:succinoglycan biosynthesis transport protein ExoP